MAVGGESEGKCNTLFFTMDFRQSFIFLSLTDNFIVLLRLSGLKNLLLSK